ncbi:hypothetical protein FMM05_18230 [Flavobacterium zepuense]|uniref:Outer membrane protein beta-barrel domain-containing protein n=1 Tax=Flavobacterium zepuense TaxID=2593302 RepID=A0A552UV69_9FLAO|nr:outer membrane beta-barrel protein [Flavobacterium zepuense]TRW22126.1 hypothetical protein FMM05_18230 [Flavobacterium zepuense]
MSDKKNIDRLFQEKFKDFEAAPPEFVWENIREELEEKKKKRVIPLWMRLSGVAAILIVGLFLGISYLNNTTPGNDTPVVLQNDAAQPSQPLKIRPTDNPIPNGGSITDSTNSVNSNDVNSAIVNNEAPSSDNDNSANGSATNNNGSIGNNKKGSKTSVNKREANFNDSNNAVAHGGRNGNSNATERNTHKRSRSHNNNNLYNRNNAVSTTEGNGANRGNTSSSNPANNNGAGNVNRANSVNGTLPNRNGSNQGGVTNPETAVAGADSNGTTNGQRNNSTNTANGTGSNINNTANDTTPPTIIDKDLPVNEAVAEATVDTTAVVPENELEKLLQEKLNGKDEDKKDEVADANNPKWKIKPQIAPVFYSSLSQGSPIDGQFASNSKSYDNDLSVGLGVNYAVNKRLSIRSGINTVNLSYATQDIEFYASLNNGANNNVMARSGAGSGGTATIVVQNRGNNTPNVPEGTAAMPMAFSDVIPKETYNGAMIQSTGYVEVPVELSYALLNKKFGIDIIGGVSTLFLNDNNVSVVSTEGFSTRVGEAQNLNSIHFSTNVGVGFKYRFFKSFEANFEPTFKYQVNTYSRDNGNFKPYFIGLYSGISFSF